MRYNNRFCGKETCICLIVAVIMMLPGCMMPGKKMVPPRVQIAGIEVEEVRIFETLFRVELRIINPNSEPMDIRGIDCELELLDRKIASGVTDKGMTIPGLGTAMVSVDLYSSVVDVVKGIMRLHETKALKYAVTGRVHSRGGAFMPSIFPFSSTGEFPLK